MTMTAKPTPFDKIDCTQCRGTGEHSYHPVWGRRCLKCQGGGYKLTERGKMAQKFLANLRYVKCEDLRVGETVLHHLGSASSAAYYTVEHTITRPGADFGYSNIDHCVRLFLRHGHHGPATVTLMKGKLVRKGFSMEERRDHVAHALAYQETLTKTGKPRKA